MRSGMNMTRKTHRKMQPVLARLAAICLAGAATACGGNQTSLPAAPSPQPAIQLVGTPTGSFRMSGRVMERTAQGARPLADAAVNLWVDQGRSGYSYWWWSGKQIYSNATGDFELDRLPLSTGWLSVWKDGYVSQCAAPPFS